MDPIRVGILGVSGYSGGLVLELLLAHPHVRVTYVSAYHTEGPIADIWPKLRGKTNLVCQKFDIKKAIDLCDLLFLAAPHGASMEVTPQLLKANKRVIDLSGDYRLKNVKDYKVWYDLSHSDPSNLKKAVYGLPELYRESIRKAHLLANPGCYPTAAILSLAPLVATQPNNIQQIIIDAKSGVSGAGRKATANLMFVEINENFKAYKVLKHQHTPEINLYLSKLAGSTISASFVAHLIPINQGILETIYVSLKESTAIKELWNVYKKFYKTENFVRILPLGDQPELRNVISTNCCDVGLTYDPLKKMLIITTVIDNLMKGAASQAIQNMNIMLGFKESEGLL